MNKLVPALPVYEKLQQLMEFFTIGLGLSFILYLPKFLGWAYIIFIMEKKIIQNILKDNISHCYSDIIFTS